MRNITFDILEWAKTWPLLKMPLTKPWFLPNTTPQESRSKRSTHSWVQMQSYQQLAALWDFSSVSHATVLFGSSLKCWSVLSTPSKSRGSIPNLHALSRKLVRNISYSSNRTCTPTPDRTPRKLTLFTFSSSSSSGDLIGSPFLSRFLSFTFRNRSAIADFFLALARSVAILA